MSVGVGEQAEAEQAAVQNVGGALRKVDRRWEHQAWQTIGRVPEGSGRCKGLMPVSLYGDLCWPCGSATCPSKNG